MWVASTDLPQSAGHPFYERLNHVLEDAGFEVRDVISHVTGTGFPHSRNLNGRGTGLKPSSEHWCLPGLTRHGACK